MAIARVGIVKLAVSNIGSESGNGLELGAFCLLNRSQFRVCGRICSHAIPLFFMEAAPDAAQRLCRACLE
jgi:hypothetical protein